MKEMKSIEINKLSNKSEHQMSNFLRYRISIYLFDDFVLKSYLFKLIF